MKKIIITAIAILAIFTQVIGSASAQGVELIVNGGFETPVVNTAVAIWDVFPSGTPGLGWQAEWYGGATTYQGYPRPTIPFFEIHHPAPTWLPFEGNQYTELDTDWFGPALTVAGEPASVRIFQDIPTCIGGVYELKYAWSPRPNIPDNVMQVGWGDTTIATHTGAGGVQTVWTLETQSLTATSNTTRLSFTETGIPNGVGMFLDGVSLVQTGACGLNPNIDIKPGKRKPIYLSGVKNIAVAVLGSADFHVSQIDIPSMTFAGLHLHLGPRNGLPLCWMTDVSDNFTNPTIAPDGYLDLTCVFAFDPATFSPNADGTATLTGTLVDGTPFSGSDKIVLRP